MRKSIVISAVAILVSLCWLAPSRAAEGTLKVATANPAKIFTEMQETKDLKQKMENDRKTIESTDAEKKAKLNAVREARDQLRPDSPQFNEQNQNYLKTAIEYKAWIDLQQAEQQRNQKQQMKTLFDKIQIAVSEVAKQKGLDLVIAEQRPELPDNLDQLNVDQLRALISQRNILFENDSADISTEVIALLDSKYKGGK